jgi:hypothetical protein
MINDVCSHSFYEVTTIWLNCVFAFDCQHVIVEAVVSLNIFADEEEIAKNRLLRCTVCSYSLQAALLKGRKLLHHPVLKVLMCKVCVVAYSQQC